MFKRKSKVIKTQSGNFKIYERSEIDIRKLETLNEDKPLDLMNNTSVIVYDSLKYNVKWFNPFSWIFLQKYSLSKISSDYPRRLILLLAKEIFEIEQIDSSYFKLLLGEMSKEESEKYMQKFKKKAEESTI